MADAEDRTEEIDETGATTASEPGPSPDTPAEAVDPAGSAPVKKTAARKTTARKSAAKAPTKKAPAKRAAVKKAAPSEPTSGPADEVTRDPSAPSSEADGAESPVSPESGDAAAGSGGSGAPMVLFQAPEKKTNPRRAAKKTASAPATAPASSAPADDQPPGDTDTAAAEPVGEPAEKKPKAKKKGGGGKKKKAAVDETDEAAAAAAIDAAIDAGDAASDAAADADGPLPADEDSEEADAPEAGIADRADSDLDESDDSDEDDTEDSEDSEGSEGGSSGNANRRRRRRGGRRRRKSGGTGGGEPGSDGSDDAGEGSTGSSDSDGSHRSQGDDGSEDSDRPGRSGGGRSQKRPGSGQDGDAAKGQSDGPDKQGGQDGDDSEDGGSSNGSRRRRSRRRRSGDSEGSGGSGGSGDEARARRPRNPEDEITSLQGSTRLAAKKQRRQEGREAGRRRAPIVSEAEFLARREAVDRVMVVRQREDLTQIAVLEDKVLVEHYVARESQTSLIGNVYLGRVQNVLPSMEAAFIDIGKGRNAVLYAGEVNWSALGHKDGQPRKIESVLKSGQTILVQVSKDPIGHKGARLTSQVTLPGRFLVLVPDGNTSGISRKLPDTERHRLKTLLKQIVPGSAGVIVRTAAEGASEEELTHDVERLSALWEEIEKKVESGRSPELLYGEPDLTLKVVRDLFTEDFSKLVVQGDAAWDLVDGYVSQVAPDLRDRLERYEGGPDAGSAESGHDVFAAYRLDEQIAKGLDRKVWLPSGGSLVIDRTEAMTVVDVNTGKFTGSGGNLEETVTKNNLEAAEEMVRQLRLRDIGGIIVIDFIDMVLESNRDLVLRRLVECLGRDRTRHQVAEVTSLGLVQMTRKRIGTGLLESFSEECGACKGRGVVTHEHPVESSDNDEDSGRRGRGGRNRRTGGNGSATGGNGNGNGRPTPPAPHTPSPRDLAAIRPPAPAEPSEHDGEAHASPSDRPDPLTAPVEAPDQVVVVEPLEEALARTGLETPEADTPDASPDETPVETAVGSAVVESAVVDAPEQSDPEPSVAETQGDVPLDEATGPTPAPAPDPAPKVSERRRSARRPAGSPTGGGAAGTFTVDPSAPAAAVEIATPAPTVTTRVGIGRRGASRRG